MSKSSYKKEQWMRMIKYLMINQKRKMNLDLGHLSEIRILF